MGVDKVDLLINDACLQSMYNGTINGRLISPSYTSFDRSGASYTTAKLRLNLGREDVPPASRFCFAIRRRLCAGGLADLCAGPSCMYALEENTASSPTGTQCCPVDRGPWK
ncbi:hypothetical protein GPECTOR_1g810 [Gonium pectorale]|uniref:Pherophorin domain-containing protein n=1 Tax=Gonium pectorale TaxID=33097 RepID=A0A150H425_GONPE|nr:hypothetical protein GPECTOR_1g810 [Gonium pectorale]|eukprot:KXZ56899.1 hypothetical protein GPECTOR_1g810 [Gonium pectorale]